jgi:membrane protease YdiL (CAAX protease family)
MSQRRQALSTIVISLLPWPLVWVGLFRLHSLIWAFVLYHGLCLLSPIIAGKRPGSAESGRPTITHWITLAACAMVVCLATTPVYLRIGPVFIDHARAMSALTSRGYRPDLLVALALYFTVVNPILEEFFWRGLIWTRLASTNAGALWSSLAFGAWHYLPLSIMLKGDWAVAGAVALAVVGFHLGMVYRRTGSLLASTLWHSLVYDVPVIIILISLQRQQIG